MLEQLEHIEIDGSLIQWKSEYYELNDFMLHSCSNNKWKEVIEGYIKLKQQLLQQLNEQVRPHLTDDEWTMLLIQVNSCPEIMQYLPAASESYVPF